MEIIERDDEAKKMKRESEIEKREINDRTDHLKSNLKMELGRVLNVDRHYAYDSNFIEERNVCDPYVLVSGPIRKTVRKIISTILFVFDFVSKKIIVRQIPGDDVNQQLAAE